MLMSEQEKHVSKSPKNRKINLDKSDFSLIDDVLDQPEGETIFNCFSCSTCVAGCPVRRVTDRYNPREIIRMILTGQRDELLNCDSIWLCSTCYTCQERCPQGVHIPELMMALRNIASQAGLEPAGYKKQKELILELGRLYEVDDFDNKKRRKAELPPVVTSNKMTVELHQSLTRERQQKPEKKS